MSSLVSKVIVDGNECEKVVYSDSTAQYSTISLKDAFYGLYRESSASTYDIETEILLKDEWVENDNTYKIVFPTKQLVTFNIKVNLSLTGISIYYNDNFDISFTSCWNVWKKSTQCDNLMYYYDSKKLELKCFYANFSSPIGVINGALYEVFKLVTKNTYGGWETVANATIDNVHSPYTGISFGSAGTITIDEKSNFLTVAKTLNNTNNQLYNSHKISCKLNSYIYSKEDIPDEAVQDIKLCYYPCFVASGSYAVPRDGVLTFPQDKEGKTGFRTDGNKLDFSIYDFWDDSTSGLEPYMDCFYVDLKVVKLVNYYYYEFDTNITDNRFILNNGCVFFKHKGLFYLIKSADLNNSFYIFADGYYNSDSNNSQYFLYRYNYVSHNTNSISVSFDKAHSYNDSSPIDKNFNIDFSNTTLSVLINNISLINNRENCLHESHIYVN